MTKWYPGHIAKSISNIKKQLKFVDLIIQLLDSRAPLSTYLTDVEDILKNKPQLLLLNKSDLADDKRTDYWCNYYIDKGLYTLKCNIKDSKSINDIRRAISNIGNNILNQIKNKGINRSSIRTMVIGIPNLGKSTLINQLVKRKVVNVANKPGVTKQVQWIRINKEVELLDTPGILFPQLHDKTMELKLLLINAIPLDLYDSWSTSLKIIELVNDLYPNFLDTLVNNTDSLSIEEKLILWGINMNFKTKGGEIDKERTAKTFINFLQNGKFGKFSFE